MDTAPVCVVEYHGPHVRPRLFALHERGRLWYFDLCLPHDAPGDHWTAPQVITTDEETGGVVHSQTVGGGETFMKITGHRPMEFRAEFCARLSWTLATRAGAAVIGGEYRRTMVLEHSNGHEQATPNPHWPPALPDRFVTTEEARALSGATAEIDLPAYDVTNESVLFDLKSISDARDLLTFYQHEASNLYLMPVSKNRNAHISFEMDPERWYVYYDDETLPATVRELCSALNVELVVHGETLAGHRPHIDEYLRGLGTP